MNGDGDALAALTRRDRAALRRVAGTVPRGLDGVEGIPRAVCARLAKVRERSARRHLLFMASLGQIGRRLDAESQSWVVIKADDKDARRGRHAPHLRVPRRPIRRPPPGLAEGIERTIAVEHPDLDELVRALLPRARASADRVVSTLVPSVQLHHRPTLTRAFTRSVRSSMLASAAALPARGAGWLRREMASPPPNETDDPDEKDSYLLPVVASSRR